MLPAHWQCLSASPARGTGTVRTPQHPGTSAALPPPQLLPAPLPPRSTYCSNALLRAAASVLPENKSKCADKLEHAGSEDFGLFPSQWLRASV